MPLYQLTHVNEEALPASLTIEGVPFTVTAATFHLEPPDPALEDIRRQAGEDGALSFDLHGTRPPSTAPEVLVKGRYRFRRAAPGRLEFPPFAAADAVIYVAELHADSFILLPRVPTTRRSGALDDPFAGAERWRFQLVPGPEPTPRFRGKPTSFFVLYVGEHELPRVSRLLTRILVPLLDMASRVARWFSQPRRTA
jgi:hypothetical protein